ncbi:MAG: hypothetical protein ACI8QC_004317 [Planctomycetota bacterium]|jgi:hypothetical protein
MAFERGLPTANGPFKILQPMATSVFCEARPRAWSRSPSIDL